jgi:DNA-binding response OmpR family regulator
VLIIDDNVDLAENIAEILQLDGHVTEVARSAEDAFLMARENEPDAVVAEYRLPGISGTDFVRQYRATRIRVYAMVISAHTDDSVIKQASDAGATFMAKPLDFNLLSRWVRDGSA